MVVINDTPEQMFWISSLLAIAGWCLVATLKFAFKRR